MFKNTILSRPVNTSANVSTGKNWKYEFQSDAEDQPVNTVQSKCVTNSFYTSDHDIPYPVLPKIMLMSIITNGYLTNAVDDLKPNDSVVVWCIIFALVLFDMMRMLSLLWGIAY